MIAGIRSIIRPVIVVVVIGALVLFARGVHWTETWHAVRTASPGVLAVAAMVNILSLGLKGVRWWLFLRATAAESLLLAVRATFAGAALNNLLVLNAGEAGRVLLVARSSHVASEKVFATLALERLFDFAGYVVMLATAVSLLRLPPALHALRPYAFGALVLLVALLVYLVRHPEIAELPALTPSRARQRIAHYGRGFLRTLTVVSSGRRFAGAMLISIAAWTLQVVTYVLTARAAHFDISVIGTVATLLAVNVGFALRATPGNVGVFQAMYAVTAVAFGMDADAAIGVAFLIQAQQILPITLIGLLAAPEILSERRVSQAAS